MDKIFGIIEKNLMGPMTKLSEQRHLRAIRDGIVATVPIIIVGSFFMIVAFLPLPESWPIKQFLMANAGTILIPYRMTMFIMTLYAVIGIGSSLAKTYKYDSLSGSIIALVAFLMTIIPTNLGALVPAGFVDAATAANLDASWVEVITKIGWAIPMSTLGTAGMFVGILMAIFGVEIMHFCKKNKLTIQMPASVPTSVARSFEALIPVGIVMVVMFVIRVLLKFDIQSAVMNVFKPLVAASGSFGGAMLMVLLICLLWACGIHGVSIVGAVARPLWLILLDQNMIAFGEGAKILPNVAPEPFYQWFIWIGGSGATLGLVICMVFFSKSQYLKKLGKAVIIPGLFNINEPVIYGAPIMLNPFLAIPFVIGPLVTTALTYFLMSINVVARPFAMAPWTLPAPIGAFLSTGDWKASVLCVVNIFICGAIYYPFYKAYDKKLYNEELEAEKATA